MSGAIFENLSEDVRSSNHYCEFFLPASERLAQENNVEEYEIRFNREYIDPDIHAGRQNAPVSGQVRAVF
jgi:hypothetical protein